MPPVRLDMHVHTRHSPDSILTVESVAKEASARGLSGFAITDHNSIAGHLEWRSIRDRFPELVVVLGAEVSTEEGHLLAFGISELPPAHLSVSETVSWVHERGGVAVLAHPFRRSHGVGGAVAERLPGVGIEVVNGHTSPRANRKAADLANRRGVTRTGGSDVHELTDLGRAFTVFPDGTQTAEGVLFALQNGHARPGGSTLGLGGRLRLAFRTVGLRVRRGFRPI